MEVEKFVMWYFIIGLFYVILNGAVRKIDTDGDFMLPLVWYMLWPIGFLSLIVLGTLKLFKKIRKYGTS